MKESCEKAMEVNNEPMLNDDSDEVQEITAARTAIKIIMPVCGTCNQTLALKNGCKKSISRKSTLSSGENIVTTFSAIVRK